MNEAIKDKVFGGNFTNTNVDVHDKIYNIIFKIHQKITGKKFYQSHITARIFYDFFDALQIWIDTRKVSGFIADYDYSSRFPEMSEEAREVHRMNRDIQRKIVESIKRGKNVEDFFDLYGKSLLFEAPWDFEQFLLYCELDRSPEDKFYQPRMKSLRPIVKALQKLEDGELDELMLSMPPRVGKTGTITFFTAWEIGKHPEMSDLYSSHSDSVTKAFYNGLLEIIKDPYTYNWQKVFPECPIVKLNAADQTINIQRRTKYPSLTCRSIDGTLNGACDCSNILIADDLCKGIEQAINKDVMIKLWMKTANDLLSRRSGGKTKILWIGTRWSMLDPIGCRLDMLENDKAFSNVRYEVINVPALNDEGESNFDYAYDKGFTTGAYEEVKASFERRDDVASWSAQFMGHPIERNGSLFDPSEMRYYDGTLPKGKPGRAFMAVDPAWGGSDYCAAPVCLQYGEDVYIPDVVFTNQDKRTSIPQIAKLIGQYGLSTCQIEANKMTQGFADELKDTLRKSGIRCSIITNPAPNNVSKEDRIEDRAPEIRESFIFLDGKSRGKHYQGFMDNVYSFSVVVKNKHDDAPDSLAMAAGMIFRRDNPYAHVFRRLV